MLKTNDVTYLTPTSKNIHSFTALEDTAILDILLPNYDETTRFCNFYMEVDYYNDIQEEKKIDINESQTNNTKSSSKIEDSKNKIKKPGEKTQLYYILPPFDMQVQLLQYKGEPFDPPKM